MMTDNQLSSESVSEHQDSRASFSPADDLESTQLLPLYPWLRREWSKLFLHKESTVQFVRFCVVGASGLLVNSLVMWGLHDGLGMLYTLASMIAYIVASVNNFTWNKIFTFKNKEHGLWVITKQYLRYLMVCLVGMAINLGALGLLVEIWQMDPVLANFIGVMLATASNFLGNKFFAFRVSYPKLS